MVFHWVMSDSKFPQVSRTLLSILTVLNYVVVWMVYHRPPTSKSSSPFSNDLVTVTKAPITIGIIVSCMFHSFINSLARSRYLSFFSHFSVLFYGQLEQQSRQFCKFSFLLIIIRSSLLAEIRWYGVGSVTRYPTGRRKIKLLLPVFELTVSSRHKSDR